MSFSIKSFARKFNKKTIKYNTKKENETDDLWSKYSQEKIENNDSWSKGSQEKIENLWTNEKDEFTWNIEEQNKSTWSIDDKEKSFENTLLSIEQENLFNNTLIIEETDIKI
ncbi:698_t:CDS:1, partial [Cetraspora pellucida]